jgi:hypothetical protein
MNGTQINAEKLHAKKGTSMGIKIVLLIIGVVTAAMAILGLVRGSVYCKGEPYLRAVQPAAFWLSITVYFMWSGLMGYFVFFRHD